MKFLGIYRKPLFSTFLNSFFYPRKEEDTGPENPIHEDFRWIPDGFKVCMVFNHVLRQHRHGDEALHVLELVGRTQRGENHGTEMAAVLFFFFFKWAEASRNLEIERKASIEFMDTYDISGKL